MSIIYSYYSKVQIVFTIVQNVFFSSKLIYYLYSDEINCTCASDAKSISLERIILTFYNEIIDKGLVKNISTKKPWIWRGQCEMSKNKCINIIYKHACLFL